jgi:hypothetical protein
MSVATAESKRAKDHWHRARKEGYDTIVHRYMMGVWCRLTMTQHGYNLTDMREWEFGATGRRG